MRLVSIHPSRDAIACGPGPVHLGSASDDTVTFDGPGVAPDHLTLVADARGLVMTLRERCQRVYVNARLVRERALLRYGDAVTLGANRFLVTSDAPPADVEADATSAGPGPVAVRIVSGWESGRLLRADGELRLGGAGGHFDDVPQGCRLLRSAGGIVLESEGRTACVNGWRCGRVRLASGDQIVLGEHRLVLEAPGLEYAARSIDSEAPLQVPVSEPSAREQSAPTEAWWLILAAVALAALISLFLYFRW